MVLAAVPLWAKYLKRKKYVRPPPIDVQANLRICRRQMASALGISSIIFGVALVCGGLIMRPRLSHTHPAGVDGPIEFRAIIDALIEEEDRHSR
jgi:hypothetical protein